MTPLANIVSFDLEVKNFYHRGMFLNCYHVMLQLRGAQVLEAARLHKQGFPYHVPLAEFRRQFRLLAGPTSNEHSERPLSPATGLAGEGERQAVTEMLAAMESVNPGSYRVGLSKASTFS
jgi:myosin heavy subunit